MNIIKPTDSDNVPKSNQIQLPPRLPFQYGESMSTKIMGISAKEWLLKFQLLPPHCRPLWQGVVLSPTHALTLVRAALSWRPDLQTMIPEAF